MSTLDQHSTKNEPLFSFFKAPIQNRTPFLQVSLKDTYSYIIGETARHNTRQLREMKDVGNARNYKSSHFDYCTFAGTFSSRKANAIVSRSGLICFDFDHVVDITSLKNKLLNDPNFVTRLLFTSPSGDGLKWIISFNADESEHREYFSAVANYLHSTYHVEVDKSGSDICRACFLPHDPDAYLNDDPSSSPLQSFIYTEWLNTEAPDQNCRSQVEEIVRKIEVGRIDIAHSYTEWRNVGFALVSEFGASGRDLFHRISQFHPKYNQEECDSQFDYCLNSSGQGITIRTFYYHAAKAGIRQTPKQHLSADTDQSAETANAVCEVSEDSADNEEQDNSIAIPPMVPISTLITSASLPPLLQKSMSYAISPEDADLLLIGSLIAYSACLPNVQGIYDARRVYANLYGFFTAPASSGKGRLSLCKNLIMPIHTRMRDKNNKEWETYKRELAIFRRRENVTGDDAPEAPPLRALLVPGNSSATAVYELLDNNDGKGIIFETEGDTLTQAFRSDFCNFSAGLRLAFHHESISYQRRKDHEYVELKEPQLSVLITGTPQQVIDFIPNTENGLFCRFIFYYMELNVEWRNVFENTPEIPLDDTFLSIGEEFMKLYDELKTSSSPYLFHFTQQQVSVFNSVFQELQQQYLQTLGLSTVATIRRMGLITFRIAMILTVLRQYGIDCIPHRLECNDTDFQNALVMARSFLQHTSYLLQRFPKLSIQDAGPIKAQKQRTLYSSLPSEFNRRIWDEKAKEADIKVKTAERYLPKWCELGYLIKIEKDHYKKNL